MIKIDLTLSKIEDKYKDYGVLEFMEKIAPHETLQKVLSLPITNYKKESYGLYIEALKMLIRKHIYSKLVGEEKIKYVRDLKRVKIKILQKDGLTYGEFLFKGVSTNFNLSSDFSRFEFHKEIPLN